MGIGLIHVIPWTRIGAIVSIVTMALLSCLVCVYRLIPTRMPGMYSPSYSPSYGSPYPTQSSLEMTRIIQIATVSFVLVFAIGICVLLIYFLTRPNMVEAFDRKRA